MTYYTEVTADSPTYHYKMGEASGNALDSGSQGRNLTVAAGVTRGATGIPGNTGNNAMTFAGGTTSYLSDTAHVVSYASDDVFTAECWFKTSDSDSTLVMWFVSPYWYMNIDATGKLSFTAGTVGMTSPSAVNNNQWHHAVAVISGTSHKLYLDGAQVATGSGDPGTLNTNGQFYVGDNRSAYSYTGQIDEVAIYNSALSASRVTAHYDAGMGYIHGGYTAQAMTATATSPDALGEGAVRTRTITKDAYYDAGAFVDNTSLATGKNWYVEFPAASLATGEYVQSAKLHVRMFNVTSVNDALVVYKVTGSWPESGTASEPTSTFAKNLTITWDTVNGYEELDVTEAYDAAAYGVKITGSIIAVASSDTATAPYVVYTIGTSTNVNPTASPSTASAQMPDPVISTTSDVSTSGQPMAASALVVSPSVSATSVIDVTVNAEEADASALMPAGSNFSGPATVAANAMTASAENTDVVVETTSGVLYNPEPMRATAVWNKPALVNGVAIILDESEDAYFQKVYAKGPKHWYRLNDLGSVAHDRITELEGTYLGVQMGQNDAPDGRHSAHFDGTGSIEQTEPSPDETLSVTNIVQSTLEFSFRTTKANTFLLVGKDSVSTAFNTQANPAREVYLKNGKITYKTWFYPNSLGTPRDPIEFSGFKNLADGEWHHVVIKGGTYRFAEYGVEVWIDGKFEVRRVSASAFSGFPDWIGGRPAEIDGYDIGALPGSQWFEGDMSEIVFYPHINVTDHDIPRHYYAFMGWNPIEANPAEAFAFTPSDSTGKGNQKRALYLWWGSETDRYNVGGDGGNNKVNFDPLLGFAKGSYGIYDYEGYKVFATSVTQGPGYTYRSEVTDAPSLIDLTRDVNLSDYDVIMFADWPDEGSEIDQWESLEPGGRERLINQLRDANDMGIGLMVTHPRLAVDLGIVDRVDFVPTLKETRTAIGQGAASGLYDYGSAYDFPWNITADAGLETTTYLGASSNGVETNRNPAYLAQKAFYYGDTHKNDRFRVRAMIEGLTDIPSYMISNAVYYREFDLWGWNDVAYKYLHRMDGLLIGDEYLFHGTDMGMTLEAVSADFNDVRVGRWYGTYATPLANVKAGTVVTTFGQSQWVGQSQVENPYKDYATTIVLRPGDVLAGRPVGGKIFANYTEQPNRHVNAVPVQVLPEGDFPYTYTEDTAEQKTWEYSFTRKTLRSTSQNVSDSVSIVGPTGQVITVNLSGSGANLTMTRSNNIFPVEAKPSFQMVPRGLIWLQDRSVVEEGAVTIAAEPLEATATVASPTAVAQRDVTVSAQALSATAVLPKVAEDESGDAFVITLPMTADATITGYGKTITVSPMTATADMPDIFVGTTGEQIVLTLHSGDITLFMKEEV